MCVRIVNKKNVKGVLKKKNNFFKHLFELSDTYYESVIWMLEFDSKNFEARKNTNFFRTFV